MMYYCNHIFSVVRVLALPHLGIGWRVSEFIVVTSACDFSGTIGTSPNLTLNSHPNPDRTTLLEPSLGTASMIPVVAWKGDHRAVQGLEADGAHLKVGVASGVGTGVYNCSN